jgi:hypothetical protein
MQKKLQEILLKIMLEHKTDFKDADFVNVINLHNDQLVTKIEQLKRTYDIHPRMEDYN